MKNIMKWLSDVLMTLKWNSWKHVRLLLKQEEEEEDVDEIFRVQQAHNIKTST